MRGRRVVVEIDGTWFPGVAQAACGKGKGKGKSKSKKRRQAKTRNKTTNIKKVGAERAFESSWWTVRFDDGSLLVCHLSAACRGLKWVFEFEAHN